MRHSMFSILLLVLSLTACTQEHIQPPTEDPETYTPQTIEASLDVPVSIHMSDTLLYKDTSLTITDINDSRCPKDTECYWQGFMLVSGNLRTPDGTVKEMEWYFLMSPYLTVSYHLKGEETWTPQPMPVGDVQLTFTDVAPLENTPNHQLEDYVFTLVLNSK